MTSSSALSRPTNALWRGLLALATGIVLWLTAGPAAAQIGSDRYSAMVVDARNGTVLIAASPDEPRYPASLTKMMTLYMLFEALREGRVQLTTPIRMSEEAASRPPSKLGLRPGMTLTAEQAIYALVTKSANDVASAVGEHLGGSEDRFAQMMTLRARAIGMTRTTFHNASGLPDPENVTTARDMATLGLRLIRDFPDRYHYFGTVQFAWGRQMIRNHNRMVGNYDGADGMKTGYIRDSGFNIVTSAQRDGVRLVGVTMGGSSWVERDRHMGALLDQGFAQVGVAPRAPSALMAGGVVGAAHAASRVPDRRTAAARNATTSRVGAGRGTTAAAAATRAITTPPTRRNVAAPRRSPAPTTVQRTSARGRAPVEQGSRSTSSLGTRSSSLPAPVRRSGVVQAQR